MASTNSMIPPTETSTQNSSSLILPPSSAFGGNQVSAVSGKQRQQLAEWVRSEYVRSKSARAKKQSQWQINMRYVRGEQWIQAGKGQFGNRTVTPQRNIRTPERKTINRSRILMRSELSRFMASQPNIVGVPASSEAQDIRAAYAAESVWEYLKQAGKLDYVLSDAYFWMIQTGNGFIKTWWDDDYFDRVSQQDGCVRFASVKPFELFVPDLRERNVEDQPYITIATIKPLAWCQQVFKDELDGQQLHPSVASSSSVLEDGALGTGGTSKPDSCIIYETWVKPGATPLLPQGGLIITIDDVIIRVYTDGLPYPGGLYPISKIEHIPTGTFYADSPLNDTNGLQREYNKVRSDLAHSGSVFGQPHILAAKGSIVASKINNVAAQVVEYEPGMAPPSAMPMPEIPTYYVNQLQNILEDWDDISGSHDVSQGNAPAGVTAGTAINFLQERDDGFFLPETSSIEWAQEDIARKGISLFQEYVDIPRKIKILGADQSFDIIMLQGSDIIKGTDVRAEVGSGQNESKAAHDAKVLDLWSQGVIQDPTMVLKMLAIGGPQKFLDVFDAAESKAERENTKMKMISPEQLQQWEQEQQMRDMQQQLQQLLQGAQQQAAPPADPMAALTGAPSPDPSGMPGPADLGQPPAGPPPMGGDPTQGDPSMGMSDPGAAPTPQDPSSVDTSNPFGPPGAPPLGPIIPVDDFDVHEKHIVSHNTFRMSQEYELLPDGIKNQFAMHVQAHKDALMRGQLQSFLQQVPSDGSDPSAPTPPNMSVDTGSPGGDAAPGGDAGSVSGNGVIPAPPSPGGQ